MALRSDMLVSLVCLFVLVKGDELRYTGLQTLTSADHPAANLEQLMPCGGCKYIRQSKNNGTIKWIQTINKVAVYGSLITTHHNVQGFITEYEGFTTKSIKVNTTPSVSSSEALVQLKYRWRHEGLRTTERGDDPSQLYVLSHKEEDRLIWKIRYYIDSEDALNDSTPAFIIGLVDAHSHQVVRTWNQLATAKLVGIVGNKKTGKSYQYMDVIRHNNGTCSHQDQSRRVTVETVRNTYQISEATSIFTCSKAKRRNWDGYQHTRGYSPRNEAYLHAQHYVDLMREINNCSDPHKNSTSYLRIVVHPGKRFENAFFNGDFFVFGDGGYWLYPLTSLDIVCHELAHSFTQWHGGDMEYHGESGAINEAFSDIVGETCDIHYKNKNDYLLGEDITRNQSAIRNLCYPEKFGAISHYNDYLDTIEIHLSSGIYSRAWCKLAKNTGWGYLKALQVFTRANLLYWSPTMSMHCGTCGLESAANDLGLRRADVISAFHLVGLRCSQC